MHDLDTELSADHSMAIGRFAGAWAMAPDPTRSASAGRRLQAAWSMYLRDAGVGDAGTQHAIPDAGLFASDDPRRDGVLLWLADHGASPIAAAAKLAICAVGAARSLSADDLELLAAAIDLLPPTPGTMTITAIEGWFGAYAAQLREDIGFAEQAGHSYALELPDGRYQGWRAPEPAGCWAANLALLALPQTARVPIPPGTLSREVLRLDLAPCERTAAMRENWIASVRQEEAALFDVHRKLAQGEEALAGLSKNARARDAWAVLVAFGSVTRPQLMRMLGLSRAGVWLVAGQLADAGLAQVDRSGRIIPAFLDQRIVSGRVVTTSLVASEVDGLPRR